MSTNSDWTPVLKRATMASKRPRSSQASDSSHLNAIKDVEEGEDEDQGPSSDTPRRASGRVPSANAPSGRSADLDSHLILYRRAYRMNPTRMKPARSARHGADGIFAFRSGLRLSVEVPLFRRWLHLKSL